MEFTQAEKQMYQYKWAFVVGTLRTTIKSACPEVEDLDYKLNTDNRTEYVEITYRTPFTAPVLINVTADNKAGIIKDVLGALA